MATFTNRITVTTVDNVEHQHNYDYASRGLAEQATERTFADIMASANTDGALFLINPHTIYMLRNVVSIKADLIVEV